MKYLALIILLTLFCAYDSKAQISGFPTGLGIEIEGDYSLFIDEMPESAADSNPSGFLLETRSDAGYISTINASGQLDPSFRYTQSSLYTHSHRRNADAFINWRPIDNRYENRTQIFIDGARGLFQVIRGQ